jgi:hypothetical protein
MEMPARSGGTKQALESARDHELWQNLLELTPPAARTT